MVIIRIALINGDVYAERVPGYWVLVAKYEDYQECNVDTKVYLVQSALKNRDDFEFAVTLDQLLV